jgi:protein MpaA
MTRMRPQPRATGVRLLTTGLATALAATVAIVLAPVGVGPVHAEPGDLTSVRVLEPTVLGVRRIGTSVQGRPIRAFHLGDPGAQVTAVVLGSMHGNEKAGTRVVRALRRGAPVQGVNLWVIPTMNPDGAARDTRGNAHGVDLNRNFGQRWAPLTGYHYSGPRPWSEPETRALRRFLGDVRPKFVVSFHQPLYGVGRDVEGRGLQRRLSQRLDLPVKEFNCTGVCHGTMTSWHNTHHPGTAITVEFGEAPASAYLRGTAARGTLAAVRGWR